MTLEIGWQQPADDVVQVGQIKQVVQGAVGSRLRHRWQVVSLMKSGGKKAITSSKMTNLFLNCWSNNDTADFVSSVTSSTADWVR